jgi:RHS repeat-associated protein
MVSRQTYYAFGEVRTSEGNALPTDYTFSGQKFDASTSLMYYVARYYDPLLGRFTQPDSTVPGAGNPQNLNRYSYVRNNPVRYTDPTGNCVPEFDTCGPNAPPPNANFVPTPAPAPGVSPEGTATPPAGDEDPGNGGGHGKHKGTPDQETETPTPNPLPPPPQVPVVKTPTPYYAPIWPDWSATDPDALGRDVISLGASFGPDAMWEGVLTGLLELVALGAGAYGANVKAGSDSLVDINQKAAAGELSPLEANVRRVTTLVGTLPLGEASNLANGANVLLDIRPAFDRPRRWVLIQ